MKTIQEFLTEYLSRRPLFLSLIRAKEAFLYQKYMPLKGPVLDVGCGDGMFAKITFSHRVQPSRGLNPQVIDIGLDLDDSRIQQAQDIGIYKKLVTFDGVHIPFAQNYFGSVFSNCVLEHVDDLSGLLKNVHRVLKPKGLFLAPVMARPWEENLFGSFLMGTSYKNWMRKKQVHLNLFSVDEWDHAFKKAGFHIVERIGYLSPKACNLIDICHYLSVPNLISFVLFKKWVLFGSITKYVYPIQTLSKWIQPDVDPTQSGALFYVLKKT